MIDIRILTLLLTLHFISDFILQSDKMAKNKSSSIKWLSIHIVVYSFLFILWNPLYGIINGILHFIIDYFSSKLTSHLWSKGQVHNFFVVIGLDQLLHCLCLMYTYYLLL